MNITALKEFINSQNFIEQYPNITGWSISTKEINSVDTSELCVKFFVTKKKSIDKLLPEEVIPSTLAVHGIDIVTDVIETGNIKTLDSYNTVEVLDDVTPIYTLQDNADIITPTATTYFNEPSPYVSPVSLAYNIYRPLRSGVSSIHTLGTDATLGLIVKDNTDNSVVCLSNNHVYASKQMSGSLALSGTNLNTSILSARQPASSSYNPYGNIQIYPQHTIGKHKRCQTLNLNNNYIDAALVQLQNYNLIDANSNQVVGFNATGPYKFANTQEIDSLLDTNSPNFNSPVFRCGRTLGPLGFPGNIYTKNTHEARLDFVTNITQLSSAFTKVKYFRTTYGTAVFAFSGTDVYHCGYGSFNTLNIVTSGSKNKLQLLPVKFKDVWFSYFLFIGLGVDNKLYSSGFSTHYQSNYVNLFTALSSQLPDYNNAELTMWGSNLYVLKNNKINVIGQNSLYSSIGYGLSADKINTWVELPGNWDQVELFNNSLIALSGNSIFYSTPIYYNEYVTSYLPNATIPYSLSGNILNIGKFKKILNCGAYSTNLFALSTNDVLCEITYKDGIGTTLTTHTSLKGDLKAINNTDIVTGILSGRDVYIKKNSGWLENVVYTSQPLTAIQAQANSNTFIKIPGLTADDIYGEFYSTTYQNESLLFRSNSSFSVVGSNRDGCFGINYLTNDKIIINSIGVNVNVTGILALSSVLFKDCITLRSKEKSFPVTQGGDSGTAVFALLSSTIPLLSTWKCVGLIFAGPSPANDASGIICRIDRIVDSLNISPWNGVAPSHMPVIKNINVSTQEATPHTITLSGRKFYNIGLNTVTLSSIATTTTSSPTTTTTSSPTTTTTSSPTPNSIDFNTYQITTRLSGIPQQVTHTFPPCAFNITLSGEAYRLYRLWQLVMCENTTVNILPLNYTPTLSDGGHVMAYYNSGVTNSFVLTSNKYSIVPISQTSPLSSKITVQSTYFEQPLSVVYPANSASVNSFYASFVYSFYSKFTVINTADIIDIEDDMQQKLINAQNEVNNWNTNV